MFDVTVRPSPRAWSLLALALLVGCGSESTEPPPAAPSSQAAAPEEDATFSDSRDVPEEDWTIGPTTLARETDGISTLRGVRTAMHLEGGYDRVVFDLPDGLPEVAVEYVDKPVRACGSGEQLFPEGDGYLQVRMSGARAHTDDGEATARHERESHGFPVLRETVPTCDFEGEVTWVLGVALPEPYRVTMLDAPVRLAVDVRHPREESAAE